MIRKYLNRLESDKAYFSFQVERGLNYQRKFPNIFKGTVLEVGCGLGGISASLPSCNRIGLDVDRTKLLWAKSHSYNTEFVLGDATYLPFKLGSIDTVLLLDVLEHLPLLKPLEAIVHARAVLKKEGYVLVNFGSYNTIFGSHLIIPYMQYIPKFIRYWIVRNLFKDKASDLIKQHEALNKTIYSERVKLCLYLFFIKVHESAKSILIFSQVPDCFVMSRTYLYQVK